MMLGSKAALNDANRPFLQWLGLGEITEVQQRGREIAKCQRCRRMIGLQGAFGEIDSAGRCIPCLFFFSSRRRHTRWPRDWSSDVCSSDLERGREADDVDAVGGGQAGGRD